MAGFQSFFYWPVVVDGRLIRSYQSGNTLVHPDFRGQRLFARMLNYIHEPESGFNCELLIGFPSKAPITALSEMDQNSIQSSVVHQAIEYL